MEKLAVLGAEDELSLVRIEVSGDQMFAANAGQDIVKFGVGGLGKCGNA